MDDAEGVLRVAEAGEQGAHAVELQVAGLGRPPLEVDAVVPEGQGLVVGHKGSLTTEAQRTQRRPEERIHLFWSSLCPLCLCGESSSSYPCTGMHTCSKSRSHFSWM